MRCLAFALMLALTVSPGAEQMIWGSFSVRSPRQDTRIVDDGTEIDNPFDYELASGFSDDDGVLRIASSVTFERESGLYYTGQRHNVSAVLLAWQSGIEIHDAPDDEFYAASIHVARVMFDGHVAFGTARQYVDKWFNGGAWVARLEIKHSSIDFIARTKFALEMTYEFNQSRQRALFYGELVGLTLHERVRVVPFFRAEILKRSRTTREQVQGKVRVEAIL